MSDLNDLKTDFQKAMDEWKLFDENKKARAAAQVCVKVIKDNFKLQGFDTGEGVEQWKPRLPSTNKAYDRNRAGSKEGSNLKGSVYKSSKPILVQTGNLRNSIMAKVVDKDKIVVSGDLEKAPYGKFVNNTRKFLDWSVKIPIEIKKDYDKKIDAIMKKFI